MTQAEQFAALRTWLLAITGLPEIIIDHPGGKRPDGVYGMLNLLRSERVNWPDDVEYEATGAEPAAEPFLEIPVEEWEFTWSLNIYGAGGSDMAARVSSASKSAAALLSLHPLSLHRTSAVRRLPELVGERWEDRVQMDLSVRAVVRHGFKVDVAEEATVDFSAPVNRALPEIVNPAGDPVGTITVTKP